MGWIKNRIDSEYRKHYEYLDWSRIAETKIKSEIKFKLFGENIIDTESKHLREHELQMAKEHKKLFPECLVGVTIHKDNYMSLFSIAENGEFVVNNEPLRKWKKNKNTNKNKDLVEDIKTARRCMNSLLFRCRNQFCLNESCPLNKIYDTNQNKDVPESPICKCGHSTVEHDRFKNQCQGKDWDNEKGYYIMCKYKKFIPQNQDIPKEDFELIRHCGICEKPWIHCDNMELHLKELGQNKVAPKIRVSESHKKNIEYEGETMIKLKDVLGLIDEFDINNFTCKYCEGKHGDDDWSCDTNNHEQEIKKELKARIER